MRKRKRSQRRPPSPKNDPGKGFVAELSVSIEFDSARVADAVWASVLPETRETGRFRSKTTISRRGRVVRVRIEALDLVALRAAANSFLQFVLVAKRAVETVSQL